MYLAVQYLCFTVDSRLSRNEHRRRLPIKERVRLALDIDLFHAVAQLLQVQFRLDVDVLPAFHWVRRAQPAKMLLLLLLQSSTFEQRSTPRFLLPLQLR